MVAAVGHQADTWRSVTATLPLEVSLAAAGEVLAGPSDRWLPLAVEAYALERDSTLMSIGLGGMLSAVQRQVRVTVGQPTRSRYSVRRPLTWAASAQARLYPAMEGSVTVTRYGEPWSVLEVRANYLPPLGAVGRLADRALLHLVAAASIRRFTEAVGDRLATLAAEKA